MSETTRELLKSELEGLPVQDRLSFMRGLLVPSLEDIGYHVAQRADNGLAASLFILATELDKRLGDMEERITLAMAS